MSNHEGRFDRDRLSRQVLSALRHGFARYFSGHPEAVAEDVSSPEILIERRTPDAVIRVKDPLHGEWLVVIEVQSRRDPDIGKRLARTALWLHTEHGLPVLPVVIHLTGQGGRAPEPVTFTVRGVQTRFEFLEINLWELDAREILASGLQGPWWPFIAYTRGGGNRETLERLIGHAGQDPVMKNLVDACLRISRFVVDMTWAEPLLQGGFDVRWLEDLEPLEGSSEWKVRQALIQKATAEATAETEARMESRMNAEIVSILRRLIGRFIGIPDAGLQARLETLSREKAEDLIEHVHEMMSLAEVEAWIDARC